MSGALFVAYEILLVLGLIVTLGGATFYGLLAPWYRSVLGRITQTLLTALSLVFIVLALGVLSPEFPGRRLFAVIVLGLLVLTVGLIDVVIVTEQLKGQRIKKNMAKVLRRQRN